MLKNFFSRKDLGGINPEEFRNDLKFLNLKTEYLNTLSNEILFLEGLPPSIAIKNQIDRLKTIKQNVQGK